MTYSETSTPAASRRRPASTCWAALTPLRMSRSSSSQPVSRPMWTRSSPASRMRPSASADLRTTVRERA